MALIGTLVVANVLFTMVTKTHIWSGHTVLDSRIASSIVTSKTTAKRGTIYDCNHNVIAQDRKAYTIVAYLDSSLVDEDGNPNYVKNVDSTVKKLKSVLGDTISEKTIKKILKQAKKTGKSQTELGTGTKRLSKETMKKIKKLKIPGIGFIDSVTRYYPTTPFSSNLILSKSISAPPATDALPRPAPLNIFSNPQFLFPCNEKCWLPDLHPCPHEKTVLRNPPSCRHRRRR